MPDIASIVVAVCVAFAVRLVRPHPLIPSPPPIARRTSPLCGLIRQTIRIERALRYYFPSAKMVG